jgi:hypothetical protein
MTKQLVLLSVALMLVVVGCGGAKKAATPEAAVLNMCDALADGSENAFVSCFDVDENGEKMLRAMFGMRDVMEDFSDKVKKAFGEEDAAKILDSQDDPFAELAALKADDLEITEAEDGLSATCVVKDSDMDEMPLVKKDGVWLIGLDPDEVPSAEEVEQGLKMVEVMKGVFEEMGDMADDEGMTVEKFEGEMGKKMMEAMMSAMAPEEAPAE